MNRPKLIASSRLMCKNYQEGLYKGERQSLNRCCLDHSMFARYRVHEMRISSTLMPGLSGLPTKVLRSLISCKTFYCQTCAKTSPILLFWPCSITRLHYQYFLSVRASSSQRRVLRGGDLTAKM